MSGQKEVVSIAYDENDTVINSREKPKIPVNEQAVKKSKEKWEAIISCKVKFRVIFSRAL